MVTVQVRALDNVLDLTYWPLQQQKEQSDSKRRIGVGFTGLGNALTMLRLAYNSDDGRALAARISTVMRDAAYRASIALAREKGAFPAFDANGYLDEGTFASRLPTDIQDDIRRHGIRNSHLLAIAPTGTVSLAFADNASNGIEPAFSWTYQRKKRMGDGSTLEYSVEDHAYRLYRELGGDVSQLPAYFVSALQMSADDHLAMMAVVQPLIDTSISKTVNVPATYPFEDFKDLYMNAWKAGLKGLATYRPNDILGAVLQVHSEPAAKPAEAAVFELTPELREWLRATYSIAAKDEQDALANDFRAFYTEADLRDTAQAFKRFARMSYELPGRGSWFAARAVDPMRSVIEKRPKGTLPGVVEKIDYWTQSGRQALYLVVSFMPLEDGRERAIEFFMPVGQNGESQQWITSTMRMLSLAARGGFLERALEDMRKVAWDRGPVRLGTHTKGDGSQIPKWHDSEVAAIAFAIQNIIARRREPALPLGDNEESAQGLGLVESEAPTASHMHGKKCPECGAHAVIRKDGCDHCTSCGMQGSCG